MALHVTVREIETPNINVEYTNTELESYYVTADQAMSGSQTQKLSFLEALQLFIV